MCSNKNRCNNFCYCCSVQPICAAYQTSSKIAPKTKQTLQQVSLWCPLPMYHVFQPLALFFILLQLFPPCLTFLHSHSLEEPSLSHGFGLRREQKHVGCLQRDFYVILNILAAILEALLSLRVTVGSASCF